jgi:hypothetical protein
MLAFGPATLSGLTILSCIFIIITGLYAGALTIMITGKFYFGWIVSGAITIAALSILALCIR